MSEKTSQRCGFVAVIGAPNAGKSTLVNALVGSKVTIVSSKVQTTRSIVRGIAVSGQSQIVFVDTPGIFQPTKRLERAMVSAAWDGEGGSDLVVLVVDATRKKMGRDLTAIIDRLVEQGIQRPCVLVLNKIDKIRPPELLKLSQDLNDRLPFQATFMVSSLKEKGTEDLLSWLVKNIPEGPFLYPEDQVSDMPVRLLAAEITREKLFRRLHQELPYGLAVETEDWEVFEDGSVKIDQVIYVAREGHKAIVLGKGGLQVKMIGEQSRQDLEEILEKRVHLKLFVKLHEHWAEDPDHYQTLGLDYKA